MVTSSEPRRSQRSRTPRSRRQTPRAARAVLAARAASREEPLAARVREADGVQHPVVGLGDADRRVPGARLGVTVFVTKASSCRDRRARTARRGSRWRSGEAQHRPLDAETLQRAADLDGAAVAGPVAAGHRCLPRELRPRRERAPPRAWLGPHASTSRPSRSTSVTSTGSTTTSAFGTSAAASAWRSVRNPSTAGGCSSASERYGSGAMPIPPPTRSGRATSSRKPLPSGPRRRSRRPARALREPASRARSGRGGTRARPRGARHRRHRPGQQPARRLEHEELPGHAGVEAAARTRSERVRPDASTATTLRRSRLHAAPGAKAPARRVPSRSPRRPRARRRAS